MNKLAYISFALAILMLGCQRFEDKIDSNSVDDLTIVQVNEDGSLCVAVTLGVSEMTDVSVDSRASSNFETVINNGWCLIFGLDNEGSTTYTNNSPLLMKVPIEQNANGTFLININPYEGTAFLRVVVNLTPREEAALEAVAAWGDNKANYEEREVDGYNVTYLTKMTADDFNTDGSCDYGTFGDYKYQSVGLDGIYDFDDYITEGNEYGYTTTVDTGSFKTDANSIESYVYDNINAIKPDPEKFSDGIPMSSIGFVFEKEISIATLSEMFMNKIYMVRVCSKLDVTVGSSSGFTLTEVYMANCAQESRLRSTVLETSFTDEDDYISMDPEFNIPVDLGGTITYQPLVETVVAGGTTSTPLYFYPNSGGDYSDNGGSVNQDINPQYVIIKGRASGYDTDGYYKVALKAQYPLSYNYDDDGNITSVNSETDITYDIIRNIDFNINIIDVDKPGYKTLADALDDDNPASNISYNITILSDDSRNEILVSNGTYYVELNTTRVYMAGYGTAASTSDDEDTKSDSAYDYGTSGSVEFTIYPNDNTSSDNEYTYYHPAVYVQADYGVGINSCMINDSTTSLVKIDLADTVTLTNMFYYTEETADYYDEALADAYDSWEDFVAAFYDTTDSVHDIWYKVPSSSTTSKVTVNYTASSSGRVRLRIGDMLKFIPVQYTGDLIEKLSRQLSIIDESDFSYDEIKFLQLEDDGTESFYTPSADEDYSWFTEDGYVSLNEDGVVREMRAMIYPKSSSGITKVYFCQDWEKDMDANDGSNAIQLVGEDGVYMSTEQAIEYIISLLAEDGYTTVYFEGDYDYVTANNADNNLDLAAVISGVNEAFSDGTIVGSYSIDVSGVNFVLESTNEGDKYKGNNYTLFRHNSQLYSVVMPSAIESIAEETFYNCPNLQFITFGGPGDASTSFTSTGTMIKGCPNVIAITIYTEVTSLTLKAMDTTGAITTTTDNNGDAKYTTSKSTAADESYYFQNSAHTFYAIDIIDEKTEKVTNYATTDHVQEVVYSNGVSTSPASYMYVFCDDDDDNKYHYHTVVVDETTGATENISNLKYYFKERNASGEYFFKTDLYTIPYASTEATE